jgi:hypothetical protein
MKRHARLLLLLALIAALGACHTDPFGLKPEVRGIEIPDKPAEPVASEADDAPEDPAPE